MVYQMKSKPYSCLFLILSDVTLSKMSNVKKLLETNSSCSERH